MGTGQGRRLRQGRRTTGERNGKRQSGGTGHNLRGPAGPGPGRLAEQCPGPVHGTEIELRRYNWCDRLIRAEGVKVTVTADGEDHDLRETRKSETHPEGRKAGGPNGYPSPSMLWAIKGARRRWSWPRIWQSNEEDDYTSANRALVTWNGTINVHPSRRS